MKRSIAPQSAELAWGSITRRLAPTALWAVIGGLLIALAYQIPARHSVAVGFNDAGYVQGFNDPINRWGVIDATSQATTPLRWSRAQSYLIFPQLGVPATATVSWRGLPDAAGMLPTVQVLLNGRIDLGQFSTTGDWETHRFAITGDLIKATDVFLELRTAPVVEVDGTVQGVQVDRAMLATSAWPILPYPAQLIYGALAVGLVSVIAHGRKARTIAAVAIALAFVLLYRVQLTPYPVRALLPVLVLLLGAIVLIRSIPRALPVRCRSITRLVGLISGLAWLGWLLLTARAHTGLSLPGVERDFAVFATRATSLGCTSAAPNAPCVLRADGFYQIGYPALLWAISLLGGIDAFAAGKVITAGAAVLLLGATWAIGRSLDPDDQVGGAAWLSVAVLALSPFVVQYSLYVGTDMPFAAAWTAAIALLLAPRRDRSQRAGWIGAALAGVMCGTAFVIRHPGFVLLPFGWIALLVLSPKHVTGSSVWQRVPWRLWGAFTAGWIVAAAPQIAVNLRDTGMPLYSQQAKNVWLAVYGNTDFGGRWDDAANNVRLRDIVLADPARFLGNWGRNLRAFLGTGAEDTREFGQAIGLRMLAFPANWLGLIGLASWLWHGNRRQRLLVCGAALYVLGVSVGFALPRFFLPLAPIWALASITPLLVASRKLAVHWPRLSAAQWFATGALIVLLWHINGPRIGARFVLDRQVPAAPQSKRSSAPFDRFSHIAQQNISLFRSDHAHVTTSCATWDVTRL